MADGKDFVSTAVPILAGAGVGVAVDRIVGESFGKVGIPNPQYSSIQVHDLLQIGVELVGAYLTRKKPMLSKFLIGMAGAVITTDVLEVTQQTGNWLRASAPVKLGNGYAGPVTPHASAIAPAVNPQAALLVGSPGGGHVVYKPNTTATYAGSNAGANNLFV